MFCKKCGTKLSDDALFCEACGTSVAGSNEKRVEIVQEKTVIVVKGNNPMATVGFIFAFFLPFLGLIFSIVGLVKSKGLDERGKGLAIAGMVISIVSMVFFVTFVGSCINALSSELATMML